MSAQETFHSARLMGAWVIDMADVKAAHQAIALCRAECAEVLEVRHTLWGVQVRTESEDAADALAVHYAPASPVALAA